jgi:hypothetical protein
MNPVINKKAASGKPIFPEAAEVVTETDVM